MSGMDRRIIAVAAVVIGLGLAGCSSGQAAAPVTVTATVTGPTVTVTETVAVTPSAASDTTSTAAPETFTMRGEFELGSSFTTILDTDCHGSGQFEALKPGGSVTIYSATGDVLHVGTITGGTLAGLLHCVVSWSAGSIPAGVGPYQYEVTGVGKWSVSEMTAKAGLIKQTLG